MVENKIVMRPLSSSSGLRQTISRIGIRLKFFRQEKQMALIHREIGRNYLYCTRTVQYYLQYVLYLNNIETAGLPPVIVGPNMLDWEDDQAQETRHGTSVQVGIYDCT